MDIVIKQSLMLFFMAVALHSCIPKKEIDPNAGVPKCNYRDGDNSSNKVFNEKFPGKKRIKSFKINGIESLDSLKKSYLDGLWIFSQPTSDFSNLCILTTSTSRNDTIIKNYGSYAGNYIGNNYCRVQTDLVFNKYDSLVFEVNGIKVKTLPQTKFILEFRTLFWEITYLDEFKTILESKKSNSVYVIEFRTIP